MKTTTAALVLACLALASCRSTLPAVPVPASVSGFFTHPERNEIVTQEVGEPLLTQGHGLSKEAIVIPFDQTIGEYLVLKGKYAASSQNNEYVRFGDVALQNKTNLRTQRGNLFFFTKDRSTKTVCVSRKICSDIEFSMDNATTFQKNSFQQTLIYNGKIGSKVTLGYREFKDGLARPAFSNEVTYDLSESKILGYKGARLEVIDVTNTEIKYKVLDGFRQAD